MTEDAHIAAKRDAAKQKRAAHLFQVNSWTNFCEQSFACATFLLGYIQLLCLRSHISFFSYLLYAGSTFTNGEDSCNGRNHAGGYKAVLEAGQVKANRSFTQGMFCLLYLTSTLYRKL